MGAGAPVIDGMKLLTAAFAASVIAGTALAQSDPDWRPVDPDDLLLIEV